ncbi:MAG: hypothetical protein HY021_00465 [Burkholderiales bacterium]|nr:hypothetical protein [Burkholderiales bacterium]
MRGAQLVGVACPQRLQAGCLVPARRGIGPAFVGVRGGGGQGLHGAMLGRTDDLGMTSA